MRGRPRLKSNSTEVAVCIVPPKPPNHSLTTYTRPRHAGQKHFADQASVSVLVQVAENTAADLATMFASAGFAVTAILVPVY